MGVDRAIVFFAHYLPYLIVLVFLFLLARAQIGMREKITIAAASVASVFLARGILTELIRYFFHRPRPFLVHDTVHLLSETSYSFPSGHATFFFALAATLYFYNKHWGVWFGIGAVCMGVARVMAGVHYPSDIIGGALMGFFCAWVVVFFVRKFSNNRTA